MLEYQYTTVINRPLEDVFDYMQDISREHEWQPNLREAEQIPEGEPGVGTMRRYVSEFMGRRFENVYVNTIYEPYHKVAYTTTPESDTRSGTAITFPAVSNATTCIASMPVVVSCQARRMVPSLFASMA